MASFVLVTKGSYGDLVPFLAIGAALKERGHQCTVITHCHYESAITSAGLRFLACDTASEYAAFIKDGYLLDTPGGLKAFADLHIFPKLSAEIDLLLDYCRPGTVLIVRHMASMAASFVAEKRQLPLVSVFTAVAQANCLPLLEHFYRCFGDRQIRAARQSLALPKIENYREWMLQADLFAGCWPPWFTSPTQAWPHNFVTLGFLRHDLSEGGPLPDEVQKFLESGEAPVLITGGTAVWALAQDFYRTAMDACASLNIRAMIVCRHEGLVPERRSPDIAWFRFLPFATLMPHIAAIIHHAGTSVLVRGLHAGVPQLCLPYGADRPDTAQRLERLGVSRTILPAGWKPPFVADALLNVLKSPALREACRLMAARMDDSHELGEGCIQFERLVAENRP